MKSENKKIEAPPFSKIPETFGLDKYSESRNWSLHEWYVVIYWRVKIQDDIDTLKILTEGSREKDLIEKQILKFSKDVLADPIYCLRDPLHESLGIKINELNERYEGYLIRSDKGEEISAGKEDGIQKKKKSTSGRRSLSLDGQHLVRNHTVADLFDSYNKINGVSDLWVLRYAAAQKIDLYARYFEASNQDATLVDRTPSWIAQNDLSCADQFVTLIADLNGTDAELKKSFNLWLKSARKMVDLPAQKESDLEANLKSWVKFSVLPFMDLLLLAQIHGVRYRLNDIKKRIYKRDDVLANLDFYSIERLRKTIQPMVLRVFSKSNLIELKKKVLD